MQEDIEQKFHHIDTHVWALTRGNRFFYFNQQKLGDNEVKWIINQKFYKELGYFPNIDHPQSYNEKIQYYKLYYRNVLMTKYANKVTFKSQIEKCLGKGYTVPLLGVWRQASEIDFDKLPKSFVMKVNNSGGGVTGIKIVRDKTKINVDEMKSIFDNWVQKWNNAYYNTLDWCYKDIAPLILAEEYIEEFDNQVCDYKFMCFDGIPKYFWIDQGRYTDHRRDIYTIEKEYLDFDFIYPRSCVPKHKFPEKYDEMVEIAKELSKPFPHARIDFYEVHGKIYVGEITFYTESGFGRFYPREWDYKLGKEFNIQNI